jgi:uncharacterized protein YoxC
LLLELVFSNIAPVMTIKLGILICLIVISIALIFLSIYLIVVAVQINKVVTEINKIMIVIADKVSGFDKVTKKAMTVVDKLCLPISIAFSIVSGIVRSKKRRQ